LSGGGRVVVRDIDPDHREAFLERGHLARHFFPHRVIRVRKGGPDGLKLARRMCGDDVGPEQLWELVVHALPPVLDDLPPELFFDRDIVWHEQHLGLPGHVGTASVVERGTDLFVPTLVSDTVQRIGRRRELKTQVEKRFNGWSRMFLHAVLDFASDRGARRVFVAGADLAYEHADPTRDVQRAMFDRVYDGSVGPPYRAARDGRWWRLDVADNAGVVVRPRVDALRLSDEPAICVCHDIERGWGHLDEDPAFAAAVDVDAPRYLDEMLEIEAGAGVTATYNIVGFLLPDLVAQVRGAGHCVGFHSYDHASPGEPGGDDQLRHCRAIDYRIKGYRPARSGITTELTDENLAWHNFEWLASSTFSLRLDQPALEHGVVRIPILFDDAHLHNGAPYSGWEKAGLRALADRRTAVFSLHDCYAPGWLPDYAELLRKVADLGRIRSLDEVAAEVLLGEAV
jgi:hypothetical protein